MFHKKSIIDVIIVEGKSDTKKLQKIFNVDTIETNGSALSEHTINLIKNVSKIRPIILFLDPDGPGEKIRKKLEKVLTVYKQAFIKHNTITSKKFGVAEATDKQIMDALSCVVNFDSTKNSVTWLQYLSLKLDTKNKRQKVCDYYHISLSNHKQLFKRLNMMGVTAKEISNII